MGQYVESWKRNIKIKAVTVKLTRTLAIIPITLGLSFIRAQKKAKEGMKGSSFSLKKNISNVHTLFCDCSNNYNNLCT